MPFKTTYAQITNPTFISGMRKLTGYDSYPSFKISYNIAMVSKRLDEQLAVFHELRKKVIDKYRDKDQKEPVITPDVRPAFEKEMKELADLKITIERHKIPIKHIEKVGLTPSELLALECALEGLEDDESGETAAGDA